MNYVIGAEKLLRKFNNLDDKMIEDFLEEACLMVERDAKILCPTGNGELRNSITSKVDGKEGRVGSNLEYAPYVHQGTGIYAVNGDGRKDRWKYQDAEGNWHSTIGQEPNPFLQKALVQNKKEIRELLKEKVREAVK